MLKTATVALKIAFISILAFLISSYFIAIILGITLFFFTPEGLEFSATSFTPPIQLFFAITFRMPTRINFGLGFVILSCLYALCFIAAWASREPLPKTVKSYVLNSSTKIFNNSLLIIPILASVLFVAVVGITYFQETFLGIPTGSGPLGNSSSDPLKPFRDLFTLAYIPFFEEISFRISPIGFFMLIYLFQTGRMSVASFSWRQRLRLLLLTFLNPDKAKKAVGLKSIDTQGVKAGISIGEWFMIVFTSVIFGGGHYWFGSGWEAGKITSASLIGFVFALSYLVYGAHVPILIHWFFNYYFEAYLLGLNLYPDLSLIYLLVVFFTLLLGIFGFLAFAWIGLVNRFKTVEKETQPSVALDSQPIS